MKRQLSTPWLALLACAASGCGRDVAPVRIALARGFVPAAGEELARAWAQGSEPIRVRPEGAGHALWLEVALPAGAWRANDESAAGSKRHEWRALRPLARTFQNRGEEALELELGGIPVAGVGDRARAEERAASGEDVFFPEGPLLVLQRARAEPPGAGHFACRMERGRDEQGSWRAVVQDVVADGLSVWPGESFETSVDVPPRSALRFATVSHGLGRAGRVTFRVLRDGTTLLEHEEELGAASLGTWHELPLASAGRARFTFEVRGAPGLTAFLHPWIAPLEVGTPGARPWTEKRPDVVLFLADTFRADLMAAGWAREVVPNLDRLAERSLCFLRARSPSTSTLPAQSSLFTGLFPTQHGALRDGLTFSPTLVTLAEHLTRAGYRTGAVTDAGFVSRQYGFDQGFEWFREQTGLAQQRLSKTLRAANEFLARDDGRPAFLFVHTYRTHWPYRTGRDEDRSAHEALNARFSVAPGEVPDPEVLAAFAGELAALYRQGASALDEQVGAWVGELEHGGFFRQGYLVFTSDHGEAFFEHGKSEHGGPPYEEELRIPLFLFGPGIEARSSLAAVSLLDVTPTLAELCGIAPDPDWCGRSLLGAEHDRLTFGWQSKLDGSWLSLVAGERKLILEGELEALESGAVKAAFELGRDPAERANVLREGALWPAELARSAASEFEPLSRMQAENSDVEISAQIREELARIGYGR